LAQRLAEAIQKTCGDSELAEELGRLLTLNPGYKLSIILSVSLNEDGRMLITHSSSTDTALGARMSGGAEYQLICETQGEELT
jgi:hypothetical protein